MQPHKDPLLAERHLRHRAECPEQGGLRVGERALQGARAAVASARTAAGCNRCRYLAASKVLARLRLAASLLLTHAEAASGARLAGLSPLRKQTRPAGRARVRAGAELRCACCIAMAVASGRGCSHNPLRLRILNGQLHALPFRVGSVAAWRLQFGAAVAIRQGAGLLHRLS